MEKMVPRRQETRYQPKVSKEDLKPPLRETDSRRTKKSKIPEDNGGKQRNNAKDNSNASQRNKGKVRNKASKGPINAPPVQEVRMRRSNESTKPSTNANQRSKEVVKPSETQEPNEMPPTTATLAKGSKYVNTQIENQKKCSKESMNPQQNLENSNERKRSKKLIKSSKEQEKPANLPRLSTEVANVQVQEKEKSNQLSDMQEAMTPPVNFDGKPIGASADLIKHAVDNYKNLQEEPQNKVKSRSSKDTAIIPFIPPQPENVDQKKTSTNVLKPSKEDTVNARLRGSKEVFKSRERLSGNLRESKEVTKSPAEPKLKNRKSSKEVTISPTDPKAKNQKGSKEVMKLRASGSKGQNGSKEITISPVGQEKKSLRRTSKEPSSASPNMPRDSREKVKKNKLNKSSPSPRQERSGQKAKSASPEPGKKKTPDRSSEDDRLEGAEEVVSYEKIDIQKYKQLKKEEAKKKKKKGGQSVEESIEFLLVKKPKKADKKQKAMEKRVIMKENEMLTSSKYTWRIVKLLGSGGFGDVYKVKKENDPDTKEYAMKTEMATGDKRLLRLKVEVMILLACTDAKVERKKHFVEVIDRAKTDMFKFMVMTLVGPSLEDVRKQYLGRNFSRSTAMQTALQTLQSVADLHDLGFIHRDIKPPNFAVGLADKENLIYMLDFGIARKIFKNGTRDVKVPRMSVKFLGTLRFASRACHRGVEQGRKDDLETWAYLVYDIFDNECGLPWKRAQDRSKVVVYKQKFFNHGYSRSYNIVPKEFKGVLDYIDSLHYRDEPDYSLTKELLMKMAENHEIKMDKQLDWIGRLKKKREIKAEEEETSSDNRQSGSDDSDSEDAKKKGKKKSKKNK